MATRSHLRDLLFRAGVVLKGIDGILEVLGAFALWIVNPSQIARLVNLLTYDELAEDPHDFIANHLLHAIAHFTSATQHFMAIYLFGHGIVKLLLVVALLKRKIWAFPTAILIFGGFVVSQIYRYTFTHSLGLILITLIDLVVIWFVWLEYRSMKHPEPQP